VHFSDFNYTRMLLQLHERFSLMLLCWNPQQGVPLHSHNHRWGLCLSRRKSPHQICPWVSDQRIRQPLFGMQRYPTIFVSVVVSCVIYACFYMLVRVYACLRACVCVCGNERPTLCTTDRCVSAAPTTPCLSRPSWVPSPTSASTTREALRSRSAVVVLCCVLLQSKNAEHLLTAVSSGHAGVC
jgi:hypothetical protein